MTRLGIAIALLLCAGALFGAGAIQLLVASSEAYAKGATLWHVECAPAHFGKSGPPPDIARDCDATKKRLIKNLNELAKFVDQLVSLPDQSNETWLAQLRLRGRAARYYVNCFFRDDGDSKCETELAAISEERKRLQAAGGNPVLDTGVVAELTTP